VRGFSLARLRDDDQGAVLAIVAISLLVLLGMLVLTFDLGHGVALKRNMVNAADSGALAAARECGLANGEGSAKAAAGVLVADNNSAATVTGFQIDPSPAVCSGAGNPDPDGKNTVTVTVSVPQEYFFAQIFGFDGGTVVASATAEWTAGVPSPAPLKLDQLKVEECEGGVPDPEGRIDCYFAFEPPKSGSDAGSDWGWLNLPEGWPIQGQDTNPMTCTSQKGGSKDLAGYIGGMGGIGTPGVETFQAALWDPTGAGNPPTYVCSSTGHKERNVEDFNGWVTKVQQMLADGELGSEPTVLFPIVAGEWQFTPGTAYPVVRLQGFYFKQAWNGPKIKQDPEASANCHFEGPPSRGFCIHLQTTGADTPTAGGGVTVRLIG
jgi:Flp pilus assembly protein TadG